MIGKMLRALASSSTGISALYHGRQGTRAGCPCLSPIMPPSLRRVGVASLFTDFIYFQAADGASLRPEHKCPRSRNEGIGALPSETAGPGLPPATALLRTG